MGCACYETSQLDSISTRWRQIVNRHAWLNGGLHTTSPRWYSVVCNWIKSTYCLPVSPRTLDASMNTSLLGGEV